MKKEKLELSQILGEERSKQEILDELMQYPDVYRKFLHFKPEYQEKVMEFLQGRQSIRITYDTVFRKIFDAETHPERVEDMISCLMGQKIKIKKVLPPIGNRLVEAGSLVIMDILIELEDGSITDLEMQKIGYKFPGERSSCYAADMIMRQYNRIRNEKGDAFLYRDMKPAHLIIFMEESASEFLKVKPHYIHKKLNLYDSGVSINALDDICYISLDTFRETVQNINNRRDAWLMFLSSDKSKDILKLVESYPDFLDYYKEIAEFRTHPKELIGMLSEWLSELDHNTELYMIDEMRKERQQLEEENKRIEEQNQKLGEQNQKLGKQNQKLGEQNQKLEDENESLRKRIAELEGKIVRSNVKR